MDVPCEVMISTLTFVTRGRLVINSHFLAWLTGDHTSLRASLTRRTQRTSGAYFPLTKALLVYIAICQRIQMSFPKGISWARQGLCFSAICEN